MSINLLDAFTSFCYKNPETSEMATLQSRPTQEQAILNLLVAAYPEWTPAPVLARISLQYSARIFSLRRKNWQIANRVEVVDGVRHGYFRLAQPMTWPNPKSKSIASPTPAQVPAVESGLLFDVAPEMRHRDDG